MDKGKCVDTIYLDVAKVSTSSVIPGRSSPLPASPLKASCIWNSWEDVFMVILCDRDEANSVCKRGTILESSVAFHSKVSWD